MTLSKRLATGLLAVLATAVLSAPAAADPVDNIVFFGDSLSDTGNVWYATGGFPPAPYNQGSNAGAPDFTGGQWSDPLGPSWPTLFAAQFGLTATPSLVGGNNYAWGGARTGENPEFPLSGGVPWLDQQVALYLTGAVVSPATTLASIMIGGNDVAAAVEAALFLGDPTLVGNAVVNGITNIANQLVNLYSAADIRQFLVANVPDIGASPRFQEIDAAFPGTAAFATYWTMQWNEALAAMLHALDLPGADIDFLDLFAFGSDPDVLAGFANTTDPCFTGFSICDNPGSYFYWDSFHPSSTTHALIAGQALAAVPEPGTLALLALGLFGLALSRRRKTTA